MKSRLPHARVVLMRRRHRIQHARAGFTRARQNSFEVTSSADVRFPDAYQQDHALLNRCQRHLNLALAQFL
jgi:hypothetical protein